MKKTILISIVLGMMFAGMAFVGNYVHAQSPVPGGSTGSYGSTGVNTQTTTAQNQPNATLQNPLNANSVQDVIYLAVDIAVYVGLAFAVLAIIFVGFKFIAAQGKPKELEDAKKWFLYIIIGLAILISAKVVVTIVKTTLVNSGVVVNGALN